MAKKNLHIGSRIGPGVVNANTYVDVRPAYRFVDSTLVNWPAVKSYKLEAGEVTIEGMEDHDENDNWVAWEFTFRNLDQRNQALELARPETYSFEGTTGDPVEFVTMPPVVPVTSPEYALTVESAEVVGDDLILTRQNGTEVNAGSVRGDVGPEGPPGIPGPGAVSNDVANTALIEDEASLMRGALDDVIEASIAVAQFGLDTIVTATLDTGDTYVLDPTAGDQFILTLTGDATLTIPTFAIGSRFLVQVNQDATGGHTLTLPSAAGPDITLNETANTYEMLVYRCWDASRLDVSWPTSSEPIPLPFGPDSVINGLIWIDGDTIAGDAGDEIASWTNLFTSSTYPINAATGTSAKPRLAVVNGVNVAEFDGVNEYFSTGTIASLAQPITLLALYKRDASTTARASIFAGGATGTPMMYVDTVASGSHLKIHAGSALDSGVADDNSWTIGIAKFNTTTSSVAADASTPVAGAAGSGAMTSIRIGRDTGTVYLIGQIAMLVAIGHVSDADEIANIVALMNAKRAVLEP